MVICLCNGYTEKQIKDIIEKYGYTEPSEIYAKLGNGARCGICLDTVREIIEEIEDAKHK